MDEQSELRLELKRDFTEFLDQDFGRETGVGRYVKKVDDILKQYAQTKRVRLEVDLQGAPGLGPQLATGWGQPGPCRSPQTSCSAQIAARKPPRCPADLSDYNAELHRRALTSPSTCLPPFEEALEEFIRNRSPKVAVGSRGLKQWQQLGGAAAAGAHTAAPCSRMARSARLPPFYAAARRPSCARLPLPACRAAAGGGAAGARGLHRRVWAAHHQPAPPDLRGAGPPANRCRPAEQSLVAVGGAAAAAVGGSAASRGRQRSTLRAASATALALNWRTPSMRVRACCLLPAPQFLSKLVNLQGIVTRCTLVRPKIVKSVHW